MSELNVSGRKEWVDLGEFGWIGGGTAAAVVLLYVTSLVFFNKNGLFLYWGWWF